ncbi:G-protein coupled receptor 83-like [Monodelphis domestica]|uniref:Probable G-protein coupled receptor 83 n=1 Tax=Monodelphis domestica TaxID=13616 RepID=F6PJE9_MONDO|nr:G-protein coupled receptor 83-like [Monodelphis domestica]
MESGALSSGCPQSAPTGPQGLLDGSVSESTPLSLLPDSSTDLKLALTTVSSDLEEKNSSLRGLLIFGYLAVIIVSLVGNFLVCKVIMKRKRVHSATGLFIVNLAGANVLITVLHTPFTLVNFISSTWVFGYMMCQLSRFVHHCSVSVSVLTLGAVALDRHQVTMHPLKARMSTMKGGLYIIVIWIMASCFSLPHALYQRLPQFATNETDHVICIPKFSNTLDVVRKYLDLGTFLLLYFVPLVMILAIYSLMAKKLWLRNAIRDTATEHSITRQQKKRMTLKMLAMVVIVFTICWLPLNSYEVLLSSRAIYSHDALYFAFHWFAMSSTCYNPFIYFWLNKSFRNELKIVLRSWWRKVMRRNQRQPPTPFRRIWRESYPFWESNLSAMPSENPPSGTDHTDIANINPVIEMT